MFFLAPIVCTVCDFSFSQQIVKNFVPVSENVWTILHSIKIHENMTVMQFLSEKWEGEDNVKYVWNNLSAHFSREEENSQRDKTFHFRALSQDQILTPALFTRNSSWYFKAYCISEVCVELDFDADAAYWNFYHSCEENGRERGIFLLRSQDGIFLTQSTSLGVTGRQEDLFSETYTGSWLTLWKRKCQGRDEMFIWTWLKRRQSLGWDEASTNSLSLFKPLWSFFLLILSVLDKEPLCLKVLAIVE